MREQARALGLAGWVKNLSDGSVELQAEGTQDALASLMDAVRDGPPASDVRNVVALPAETIEPMRVPFTAIR